MSTHLGRLRSPDSNRCISALKAIKIVEGENFCPPALQTVHDEWVLSSHNFADVRSGKQRPVGDEILSRHSVTRHQNVHRLFHISQTRSGGR